MGVRYPVILDILNVNMAVATTHIFNVGSPASGTKFIPEEFLFYGITTVNTASENGVNLGEASAYENLIGGQGADLSGSGLHSITKFNGEVIEYSNPLNYPTGILITMPSPIGLKIQSGSSGTAHFFLKGWFVG